MPALVEAEPAQTLFAEETYQFALRFDEAVTIVSQDALRFASNGVELPGLAAGATVSSEGHVIRFEYTVPSEAARTVLAVTLRGEAVRDDMQRALPSDVTFTRRVESPCGPSRQRTDGESLGYSVIACGGARGRAGFRGGSWSGSVQMSAKQRAVRVPVRKAGRVDGVLSVWSVRCLLNQQSRNRGINGK